MSTTLLIYSDKEDIQDLYRNSKAFHVGDSGVDLFTDKVVEVTKEYTHLRQFKIDFGISCEMIQETGENVSYLLVPRSSIVKTMYRMSNSIGVIDAGYRGNIMAYVDVLDPTAPAPSRGDRLFQIVNGDLRPIQVKIVDSLSTTTRGSGGFGSTN